MHQPSRRRFLASTVALGTALAASGLLPGRLFAKPASGPIGIQLWAVRDALARDPAGTLGQLARIGFTEVEPAGLAGLQPKQFRRLLDDAGLRCPSAHLPFDLDRLDEAFAQAHVLGATYATASSLMEPVGKLMSTELGWKSAMTAEEAKRTAETANRIGEAARRADLQFALHNHEREFVDLGDGEVGYDIVWRDTDTSLVQFQIDCGWMVFAGRDPVDYLKRHPGRVPLLHAKDFLPRRDRNAAPTSEEMVGAELGRGVIDYKPIFAAAKAAGLKHVFAEQDGPLSRTKPLESAQVAYDYLDSVSTL